MNKNKVNITGNSKVSIIWNVLPMDYSRETESAIISKFDKKTEILENSIMTNPGIYVPELKEIIFGDSSWWHEIKSEEELREITDDDINNTWYVRLLRGE